ncbi:hypothetical protein B0H11DRAFT_1022347 [Mycena galericulata]|nr:hypothetical protein B0H11DRAFT_1022347 [Mycena galericulata]
MSPDGDQNRRKRARSASSLSSPEDRSSDASSSTLSSFDSDPDSPHSSQAAARRHLLLDLGLGRGLGSSVALGLSMASAELQLGIPEPPPRIPTPELLETDDVEMPDIDMHFSRREEHEDEEPTSPAEHVRRSVDRFNAFDRHISVLRSSSPPIIPLPASLSSRQASQSPPILPPLPLVDFGLDAEDDEDDDPDHIPSTAATNTTTSTPPRLDLNLPSTSSLSSRPSSPHLATDETSSTQFRERLDSAIDGLGGGDLQIPPTYSASPPEQRPDDNSHESIPDSLANANGSASTHRSQPLVETPLFEWPPSTLDWNMALGPPADRNAGTSADTARSPQLPPYSPWRPPVRPAVNATAATDTTTADIRRFIGRAYSPPSPIRLYPRPASLAAPLSVPATSASLDADLVECAR